MTRYRNDLISQLEAYVNAGQLASGTQIKLHVNESPFGPSFGISPRRVPVGVAQNVAGELVEIPFNNPDGAEEVLEREGSNIAAVLVEHIQGTPGMIAATTEYLQRLRDVTQRLDIVLVFDEVVTFPMAYGGAQA